MAAAVPMILSMVGSMVMKKFAGGQAGAQGQGGGINVTQTQNNGQPGTVQNVGGTKAGTANKNAKLALKSNKGVFDDGTLTSGRGKLLGN